MTGYVPANNAPVSVTRSAQRLNIQNDWIAVERVGVRRRIVEHVLQLQVTVRREELVFDSSPLDVCIAQNPVVPAPIVVVLHEEVPVVTLEIRPYEQAVVSVVQVADEQTFSTTLDSEQIELNADVHR
jgi:stress response protein YsnF